jgi:hypothetical protein
VAGPFDALTASETSSTSVAGHFLGDYQGLIALPGVFGAVFAASKPLAKDGPSDIFFARIPPQHGLPPGSRALVLGVSPTRAFAGRRTRLTFSVTLETGQPVQGATVRVGHRRVRTNAKGRARLTYRFRHAGRAAIAARKRGYRSRRAYVRVRR